MGDLPRTLTGGLVDPMKTKLEMMVAYLAGRKGEAAESIRRELEDPTSEASRCLEAVRSRSRRALRRGRCRRCRTSSHLAQSATGRPHLGCPGDGCFRCSSALSSAALVFIAVGVAWRAQDDRLRHLEATLARREARWGDRFNRLEAALTRREAPSQKADPQARMDQISKS